VRVIKSSWIEKYRKMPKLRELQPSIDRLTGTFGSLQPVKMGMMEA
jgi:putative component of toxin-antitoxin plasmid stabilization module